MTSVVYINCQFFCLPMSRIQIELTQNMQDINTHASLLYVIKYNEQVPEAILEIYYSREIVAN